MDFEFLIDGEVRKVSIEKKDGGFAVSLDGRSFAADIEGISQNLLSLLIEGESHLARIVRDGEKRFVVIRGYQFTIQEPRRAEKEAPGAPAKGEDRGPGGNLLITAPMPGKVIKINVAEGEEIRRNQTLAIVEAMKMENEIKSSIEGFVKKIYVAAGELVDSSKPLIEISPKES